MRAVILIVLGALAAQQPTFKVQTDFVRIDVLVERNGTPITGLAASDFAVADDGVLQHVNLLPETQVVVVSTILDVSGSMTQEKLDRAAAGIQALTAALHDRDRHEVYAFASDVRRIASAQAGDSMSAESIARSLRETGGPHTSLCDALFAAVVEADVEAGPKVAAVLTDGHNNTSWLSAHAAIDAALRHETVIYPVVVGQDSPRYPFGVPPMAGDDGLRLLQMIADRTGGRVIHADWSRDLRPVFESLIREYRQRYILSFTPERVGKGDGWHRLEVKLRNRSERCTRAAGIGRASLEATWVVRLIRCDVWRRCVCVDRRAAAKSLCWRSNRQI